LEELESAKAPSGNGSVFKFTNICYSVTNRKTKTQKKLLQDISATIESGGVLAIMGPSGAGKTTLINVLTSSAFGGVATGEITLDGKAISSSSFIKDCYVVAQQDNHWAYLTCKETMIYAAELYLGSDTSGAETLVNSILKKMGLETCKDTKVGNQFIQGLSGGQKRRLSIALALIKSPKIIFLDEPTSGLDAAAAANIMREIKELAVAEGIIVVATIHQPSTKVYEGFDQVMILSGGRLAYTGKASSAIAYFEGIGHTIDQFTNPAEFFLDLVNNDFMPQSEVDKVLDAWVVKNQANGSSSFSSQQSDLVPAAPNGESSLFHEMVVMMRRHALLVSRDPILYIGRAIIFLFANAYFAFVYFEARERKQSQALNRMWLTIWYFGVAANMGVVATYALNEEYKSVAREIKNGLCTPFSYILAKTVLEVPIFFIWAFFALGIPAYVISGFYGPNFFFVVLVWVAMMFQFEALAEVMSIAFDNPLMGMMQYMSYWFSSFLYGGFLIPGSDMVWPLKVFFYIVPFKFGLRSMYYYDNIDATYEACKDGELCFGGKKGSDILEGVGEIYPLITNENTLAEDIAMLLGIGVVFKIIYIYMVYSKSTKISSISIKKGAIVP